MRVAFVAALAAAGARSAPRSRSAARRATPYAVHRLVSDRAAARCARDARSSTRGGSPRARPGRGGRRTRRARRARSTRATGRKQLLTVHVDGGPTGIAYYGGKEFRVAARRQAPIRRGSSTRARTGSCARGRRPCRAAGRRSRRSSSTRLRRRRSSAASRSPAAALYATDFHNARVDVYDGRWHRIRRAGAFVDRAIPDVVRAVRHPGDRRSRVRHVRLRAPVNGNDAPTGGYVDEFDLDGGSSRASRTGAR